MDRESANDAALRVAVRAYLDLAPPPPPLVVTPPPRVNRRVPWKPIGAAVALASAAIAVMAIRREPPPRVIDPGPQPTVASPLTSVDSTPTNGGAGSGASVRSVWTPISMPKSGLPANASVHALTTWRGDLWAVVAQAKPDGTDSGATVWRSSDQGGSWTQASSMELSTDEPDRDQQLVPLGDGILVVDSGQSGHTAWRSDNGVVWDKVLLASPQDWVSSAAVRGPTVLVSTKDRVSSRSAWWASHDSGRTWKSATIPASGGPITSTDAGFIIGDPDTGSPVQHPRIWTSPDGEQWTSTDLAGDGSVTSLAARGSTVVASAGDDFTKFSMWRFDGQRWEQATLHGRPGFLATNNFITATSGSGAGWIATFGKAQGALVSADGRDWYYEPAPGPNPDDTVTAITAVGNGFVAAVSPRTLWRVTIAAAAPTRPPCVRDGSLPLSIVSMAADAAGGLIVSDRDGNQIFRFDVANQVYCRIAGQGNVGAGGVGGPAAGAEFSSPHGVEVGPDGSIYVADTGNNQIRKISPTGTLSVVAGSGSDSGPLGDGGPANAASLSQPEDVSLTADGGVLIADTNHNLVRAVDPSGVITTWAGNGSSGLLLDRSATIPNARAGLPGPNLVAADLGQRGAYVFGFNLKLLLHSDGQSVRLASSDVYANDIAVGPGGDLYVATNYDGIQLLRAGTSTFDSLSARPHDSSALALGADGTIYVAHVGDTGRPVIALLNAGNLLDLAASSDPRAPDTTKPPPTPDSATQPLALSIQHVIPVPSGRQRLLVNGGRAFVGTDTGTDLVVIDTTTAQEVRRISTGPTSALAAGFGSIWSCGMTEIRRIDPTAATLSTRLPIKCTFGITAAFGSLWVAGHNEVRRYSPAGVLQSTIPIDGGDWGIAAGADSIWVAYGGAPGPGPVTRIDPTTNTVRARIPVATRTREIAVTEAAVWVTTEPAAPGDPSLVRIDPTTNTTRLLLPGARDATGIAVDSTHVWVADHGGGIAALDPTTTMALGTARPLPNGTTAGGNEVAVDSAGHLWATVDRPGALMQLLDS